MARSYGDIQGLSTGIADRPLEVLHAGQEVAHFVFVDNDRDFFSLDPVTQSYVLHPNFASWFDTHGARYASCYVLLEGNIHNSKFAVMQGQPVDFWDSGLPAIWQTGVQLVPRSVVESYFAPFVARLQHKVHVLAAALRDVQVQVVLPPPPIASNEQIAAAWSGVAREQVANAWLRLKVYRLYSALIQQNLQDNGLFTLPPPVAAMDENGFLIQPLWEGATHAQPDYYRLLVPRES